MKLDPKGLEAAAYAVAEIVAARRVDGKPAVQDQRRQEAAAAIAAYLSTVTLAERAALAEARKALEEIAPGWREALHFMRNNAMDLARDYPEVVAADEAFRRALTGGQENG